MKRFLHYLFYCTNTFLIIAILFNFSFLEFKQERVILDQRLKEMDSKELVYQKEEEKENTEEEKSDDDVVLEQQDDTMLEEQEEYIPPKVEEVVPPVVSIPSIDTTTYPVLDSFVGNMSGYGPDCYGCTSNRTASGYYVGEGNIYYSDPTYGTVRIVSGDRSYPFGTIVRITGLDQPILAIILDNGGGVGFGKRVQFDLLYATESDALPLGIQYNLTFEILRYGY